MPTADNLAYDGNIVVKRTTFGRANGDSSKSIEVDRVRRAISNLEAACAKRLTFDSIDFSRNDVEYQMRVNKGVADELRKEILKHKTFVANNIQSVDNQ